MTKIMESTSPTLHTGTIRRRQGGGVKETTTEEQALNTIAKEAEARLAAKRAARAEARSIRMREISQRQKESESNVSPDEYESSEASSISTNIATTMSTGRDKYSLLRASSRSEDSSTFDIADHASSDKLILSLKETIRTNEEKYKKAMVNTAQLDNERQALLYQVETLKDDIEELQQSCENTEEELFHKNREFNKLTREHNSTSKELSKALFVVQERERILDEHGINIDGTFKDGYTPVTLCSMCGSSLEIDRDLDRDSLVAEIYALKNEIQKLKLSHDSASSEKCLKTFDELKDITMTNSQKSVCIPSLRLLSQKIEANHNPNDEDEGEVNALPTSSLRISVDNYADGASGVSSCSPSGSVTPTSNININSYLGADDHNDDMGNDENEQRTAFRLSRYFSAEPAASSTTIDSRQRETDAETDNAGAGEDLAKVNTDVECVGVVDKHPSPRHAIEEDVVFAEEVSHVMAAPQEDEEYLESLDVVDPVFDTSQQKLKFSQPNRDSCRAMSTDSEVSMYYSILPGEENNLSSSDSSMNTAFCDDTDISICDEGNRDSPQEVRLLSDETLVIRSNVEQLYNQIANETTEMPENTSNQYVENFNHSFPLSDTPHAVTDCSDGSNTSWVVEPRGWKEWLESRSGKSAPSELVDSGAESDRKDKKKKKKKKK